MSECLICLDCGAILTDEERHYYSIRCERCTREEDQRIQDWMDGGEDRELDAIYSEPRGIIQ